MGAKLEQPEQAFNDERFWRLISGTLQKCSGSKVEHFRTVPVAISRKPKPMAVCSSVPLQRGEIAPL